MKNPIFGAIFGVAVVYLLFAFANFSFDAGLWTKDARGDCSYFMLCGLIIGGMIGVFYDANPE